MQTCSNKNSQTWFDIVVRLWNCVQCGTESYCWLRLHSCTLHFILESSCTWSWTTDSSACLQLKHFPFHLRPLVWSIHSLSGIKTINLNHKPIDQNKANNNDLQVWSCTNNNIKLISTGKQCFKDLKFNKLNDKESFTKTKIKFKLILFNQSM